MSEKNSTIAPYDLITDELVKQALENDKGTQAEVLSWETKDFTNKGDNYASVVTSITVKFKDNDKIFEKSYVAKLNPLRPTSSLTDLLEIMYSREAIVLHEIADGLNVQLKNLNLPPIRTPKLYARNLEKGKEVMITENLRKQGFKMYDRLKGMDINHSLLVVEELGRLHASSLLFEETLFPKTIPDFGYFEEPWCDVSHPSFKIFNAMISSQCRNTCNFLKNVPGYEKCSKWMNTRLDYIAKYYVECFSSCKPMDVLTHGDCWTNNMLFKYDEEGNPTDIRFLDLQCSRKSSPACDLNYFYYTSLNGDMRKKYGKTLEKTYYNSFISVLELAGKEPPFTFPELEVEMINRKRFGLMAGLMALPILLAEGEDEIWQLDKIQDENMSDFLNMQKSSFALVAKREGPFNDRFLTMLDDMLEYDVFDDNV